MRIRELFGALALSMLLSGCMDSNPLEKHPPDKVAEFIMQHGNLSISRCSEIWAHPESANKTVLQDCDRTATHIANLLNEGGSGLSMKPCLKSVGRREKKISKKFLIGDRVSNRSWNH